MVGLGWWGCAKLWSNVRYEAVAQLQDQPVLPSDQPHCQPRVLPLNDEEKTRFVERLWRVATFSCVEVLAHCFMSNHFHILSSTCRIPANCRTTSSWPVSARFTPGRPWPRSRRSGRRGGGISPGLSSPCQTMSRTFWRRAMTRWRTRS